MERQVAFQTINGQYLEVDLPGDRKVWAEHGSIGAGSVFTLVDQDNGKIALRAHNRKYLRTNTSGGYLFADRDEVSTNERFKLIDQGSGTVAIQTHTGMYVFAEEGGGSGMKVGSNRKSVGAWEKFKIVTLPIFNLKRIKLKTEDGKYVTVRPDGSLGADSSTGGETWQVVSQPGGLVALRASSGKYVTLEAGQTRGGQRFVATAERPGEREQFLFGTRGGGKVLLTTATNALPVAVSQGAIVISPTGHYDVFIAEVPPSPSLKRVALRSHGGKYVSVNRDGKLSATGSSKSKAEVFRIVHAEDGTVALETCDGKYWCASDGTARKLVADRSTIGDWGHFRWVEQGPDKASLIACNGQYVCAENGGGGDLLANRPDASTWETFHVETILGVKDLRIDDLVKYAPVVYFHPSEQYPPMSIETLMKSSKMDKAGLPDTDLKAPLTQMDLALNRQEERFLTIDSAIFRKGTVAEAPMYVVPQIAWDGSYIDLHFFYLHAYNGPQSVTMHSGFSTDERSVHTFAEHQGDLEGMSVRVKPDFSGIIFVRYEVHGDSTFYLPSQVKMVHGQHPVALAAINSHCTYNMLDTLLVDDGTVTLSSHTEAGIGVKIRDFVWAQSKWKVDGPSALRPFDAQGDGSAKPNGKLVMVGVDTDGEPINDQVWACFSGRFGNQQYNDYRGFSHVGQDDVTTAGFESGTIESKIPGDLKRGNGPSGLAVRAIANVLRPAFPDFPGILCAHRGSANEDLWWSIIGVQRGRAYPDQQFTSGNQSQSAPALAKFKGKVYCAHRGAHDDRLWWTTFDPATASWTSDKVFPNHDSADPPALGVVGDELYCVHRGKSGDGHLYWCKFDAAQSTWLVDHRFPNHRSLKGPALAVYKGNLFCVHLGDNNDDDLWWSVFDAVKQTWGADRRFTNHQSKDTPALAVFDDKLYCAHTGKEGHLWWCVYDDTTNAWGADLRSSANRCSGTVALATLKSQGSFHETLYCVHQGASDDKLWLATFDGKTNTWSADSEFPGSHTRDGAALLSDWL